MKTLFPKLKQFHHTSTHPQVFSTRRFVSNEKPKIILLAGATGVGKTELAIEIAKQLDGEIISADSVQLYKECTIGSNKPSAAQLKEVPHHLIDILDVTKDPYSAADFCTKARQLSEDILSRGRVPIVTGGSGFYLDTFVKGYEDVGSYPEAELEWGTKARLNPEATYAELQKVDPEFAATISKNDGLRIARALSVWQHTGKRFTEFKPTADKRLPYDVRAYCIHIPRILLHDLLDARCEAMVSDGLFVEVRDLIRSGKAFPGSCLYQFIGYKQAIQLLKSEESLSVNTFKQFLADFQNKTRKYAHRQMPWFRKPLYKWVLNTRLLKQHMYPVSQTVPDVVGHIVSTYEMDENQFEKSFPEESQNQLKYLSPAMRAGVRKRTIKTARFGDTNAVEEFLKKLWKDLQQ